MGGKSLTNEAGNTETEKCTGSSEERESGVVSEISPWIQGEIRESS